MYYRRRGKLISQTDWRNLPFILGNKMLIRRLIPAALMLVIVSSLQPYLHFASCRTHLQDLKEVTHNIHYETYRAKRLNDNGGLPPMTVETEENHESNL